MLEVNLALLADGANISQEKKLNVLGEFNSLTATEPPWVMMGKYLVLRLQGDPTDVGPHVLGLRLLDQDGGLVWSSSDVRFTFPPSPVAGIPSRLLSVSPMPPIALREDGAYELEILLDGKARHGITLYALFPSPPPADAQPG